MCVSRIERCQLAGDDGSTGRTANLGGLVWTTARFSMPFLQLQPDSGHHGLDDPPTVICRRSGRSIMVRGVSGIGRAADHRPAGTGIVVADDARRAMTMPDAARRRSGHGVPVPAKYRSKVVDRGPGISDQVPISAQRPVEGLARNSEADVAVALAHAVTGVHQLAVGADGFGLEGILFPRPGWSG